MRFFDASIDIGRNTGANKVKQALSDLDFDCHVYEQDDAIAALEDALTDVHADPNLDVLSGRCDGHL